MIPAHHAAAPALRDYQIRAIDMVRETVRQRDADGTLRRPIVCLPTGAGKTTVAAEILRRLVSTGRRAVFLADREELIEQARARFEAFGLSCGVVKAGVLAYPARPVQVASVATLANRATPPAADALIVDECHHAAAASWARVIAAYDQRKTYTIGLTATPARRDGKPLAGIFTDILEPVTIAELVESGHLVDPTIFGPPEAQVDTAGIRKNAGEFSLADQGERARKIVGKLVPTWEKLARGSRTIVFLPLVAMSRAVAEEFCRAGYRFEHVEGGTPPDERREIFRRFRSGETLGLCNVDITTKGFDLPELECAQVVRATTSLVLWRQMIGRVMRPQGDRSVVLDHTGNWSRHGRACDPVTWSLEGKARRAADDLPALRTCRKCYSIYEGSPCPVCGDATPVAKRALPEIVDGELVAAPPPLAAASASRKSEMLERFSADAARRGYKLGWALAKFRALTGHPPDRDMMATARAAYGAPVGG